MKFIKRVFTGVVIFFVFFIVLLVVARNQIIKAGASATIKAISGLDLHIGKLDVGIFRPAIEIKDLQMLNPSSYPEKMMMDLPGLYVKYDLPSIMKGTIHLPELKIDLREFVVVRVPGGQMNVNTLQALQPKGGGKPPQIAIDIMELNIGKVIYKDYSGKGSPKTSEFDINLHERYENITDANKLVALIVSKALANTTIAGVSSIVKSADKLIGSTASTLINTTQDVGSKATKAVGQTVDKVSGSLNKLFGGQ
jgi:hypothetical protein